MNGKDVDKVPVITNGAMFAAYKSHLSMHDLCNDSIMSYNVQKYLYEMLQSDYTPGFVYPDITTKNCGGELIIDTKGFVFLKVTKYPINNIDETDKYEFPEIING